ncbi:MAG: DUF998 domain-containing protein [Flavobacteriales bacterium]|nr:DUF998 domain-containing protein [Flavobacteriales bacterium]
MPGYSHLRHFISETYASGTPWSDVLRFGGVLPGGVFFTVFGSTLAGAWRLPPAGRIRSAAIGLFYALGTVAVAFLPCDLGCDPAQVDPSPSHVLHFAAGTLTYLLTPLALLLIGMATRERPDLATLSRTALICGCVALMGVAILFFAPLEDCWD